MSKKIHLTIPEPCHEDWNKMTPVQQGRFCGSCQKQVTDFTGMSDAQLIAFFKKPSTGSVCGRFMPDQLQRDVIVPRKRIPWIKYFFQFALPAFLISTKVSAQGKVRMVVGDTILTTENKSIKKQETIIRTEEKKSIITGRVVDEMGEGIAFASVIIKGTGTGTASDNAGYFSLAIPAKQPKIILVNSSVGFEVTEHTIDLKNVQPNLLIKMKPMNTLGEVVVTTASTITCSRQVIIAGGVSIRREVFVWDTLYNKITSLVTRPKVYPNPVKLNSLLTVDIGKHKAGTHSFQFFSVAGQLISTKEIWMDENMRSIQLQIPAVSSGTYFLKIINKESGKFTSEKIIVE